MFDAFGRSPIRSNRSSTGSVGTWLGSCKAARRSFGVTFMPCVGAWESNEKRYVAQVEGKVRKRRWLPLLQAESIRTKIKVVDRVGARRTGRAHLVGIGAAAEYPVPRGERAARILSAAGFMAAAGLPAAHAGMVDLTGGTQRRHHHQRPDGYNACPGPFHTSVSLAVRATPIKGPL